MTKEAVLSCSLPVWYNKFKRVTIPTEFIQLDPEFVEYLLDDGPLVLPDSENATTQQYKDAEADDSDDDDWGSEDGDDESATPPSFPDLESKMRQSIANLGGAVFPKLDWSAPRDAAWIAVNSTLKCTTPGDLYLLLKSSEFVMHDLTMPFKACKDEDGPSQEKHEPTLVLRQWKDMATSMEFRCFVHSDRLRCLCQRDYTNFYPNLLGSKDEILDDILAFFNEKIKGKFFGERDYCFDCYRPQAGRVLLIDFNPFSPVTDSLLYEWGELANFDDENQTEAEQDAQKPEFRIIEDQASAAIRPSIYNTSRLPKDVVDLNDTDDIEKLARMFKEGKLDPNPDLMGDNSSQ